MPGCGRNMGRADAWSFCKLNDYVTNKASPLIDILQALCYIAIDSR